MVWKRRQVPTQRPDQSASTEEAHSPQAQPQTHPRAARVTMMPRTPTKRHLTKADGPRRAAAASGWAAMAASGISAEEQTALRRAVVQ